MRTVGRRLRTAVLDVRVAASPFALVRVGIIVGKHGHGSVDRNRLKRRLRELVRTHVVPSLAGVDVLVRAMPPAYQVPFAQLSAEVQSLPSAIAALGMSPPQADV